MKNLLVALSVSLFLGCASPESPPPKEHQSPRCERWRTDQGTWFVVHEMTEDSFYHDGPCPCGMTTDKDGKHLYIHGVLSDDVSETAPVSTR